jgi:hypothetical protein
LFTHVAREQFEEARNALLARGVHTSIGLFQTGTPPRRLRLRFSWFSGGIFVAGAAAAHVSVLGARLVQVEDTTIDQATS